MNDGTITKQDCSLSQAILVNVERDVGRVPRTSLGLSDSFFLTIYLLAGQNQNMDRNGKRVLSREFFDRALNNSKKEFKYNF